jgi:hypothetical protein
MKIAILPESEKESEVSERIEMDRPSVSSAGAGNLGGIVPRWADWRQTAADGIASEIGSATVLHIGCGTGELVGYLRQAAVGWWRAMLSGGLGMMGSSQSMREAVL